jgi:hypothetical protein
VVIIDCHWSPQVESDEGHLVPKWGGVDPTATTPDEARAALNALRAEYDRRLGQLTRGEVLEKKFPPIFVLIDETPELVREIAKLDRADIDAKRTPKGLNTWDNAIVILGSGGRKVNMHGHLLTVSPNVEDIGMNGAMRRNFSRIALAHPECRKLIAEEPDKDRKAALSDALRGTRYPAAMERDGEVWLLSRAGLLEMMPERIDAPAWVPPATMPRLVACEVRERVADADGPRETPEKAGFGASPQTADSPDAIIATLRFLRSKGKSREDARRLGLVFDNAMWTRAGRSADDADD